MIFKSTDDSYRIVTNFKVMYSTLMKQPNLSVEHNNNIYDLLSYTGSKYFLARDPYNRLESFYRDKFILHPQRSVFKENFQWQHCQKIFFPEYGFKSDDFEAVRNALMTTSFEKFINMLPSKYMLDRHLMPQIFSLCLKENDSIVRIDVDRILKMEEENDLLFLHSHLHIDTSIKENETRLNNIDIAWNATLRKIVNTYYEPDFEELEYDMIYI